MSLKGAGPSFVPAAEHSNAPRLPALTGLRFVAAASVMLAHGTYTVLQIPDTPFSAVYWLRQASGFGMTLFFVLSGFVIHYNYRNIVLQRNRAAFAAFLWGRFARLYPMFIVMLGISILLSSRVSALIAGHSEGFLGLLKALPFYLTFTQSWFPIWIDGVPLTSGIGGASPLTWSISTEWFFYLAYPAVALLLWRPRSAWMLTLTAIIWSVIWAAFAAFLFDHTPQIDRWAVDAFGPEAGIAHDLQGSFVRWLLYMSPYVRVGEFVLGCIVAELFLRRRAHDATALGTALGQVLIALAIVSLFVVTYLNYAPDPTVDIFRRLNMNFALAPSCAILIYCTVRYRNPFSTLLSTKPVVALGEASYSIYLIHYVVYMIIVRTNISVLTTPAPNLVLELARFAAILTVICLIALTTYALIEAPARKWLRGYAARLR